MEIIYISVATGLVALAFAFSYIHKILRAPAGNEKMQSIADAIKEGASAYMARQSRIIAIFAVLIFLALGFGLNFYLASGFLVGALLSGVAGFIGMETCVRANVRTSEAAKKSLGEALSMAFMGGSVSGLAVVGLSILGIAGFIWLFTFMGLPFEQIPHELVGFGFGASLVSLFARVGGGIFTKAADVGADLVGKVEAGIPEDDPRNPAAIADNVGDNVGDCAGMGADLFETYAVTLIAAMLLAVTLGFGNDLVLYPMLLGSVAIVASIIGISFVKLSGKDTNIMKALYKGLSVTAILSLAGFGVVTKYLGLEMSYFWAGGIGVLVTGLLVVITEYYTSTSYKPVKEIAKASETGAGTNIIIGLAEGLASTLPVVVVLVGAILGAYALEGLYGIAISAVAMLSTTGIIIAMDSYGPITDNAGGIAEMAELPAKVRDNTDALDAVGNTTKAVTKGYAVGSATLAALVLFQDYAHALGGHELTFDISNPKVLVGLLIGALVPCIFSAMCMKAVGRAAHKVVEEVRKQFKEIKGIMEGKARPKYGRCVHIVTGAALKEMVLPGLLAVVAPLLVGFILGPIALGGLLVGVIISGLLIAIQMSNGGAAWDNAKKHIEDGHHGGKGSDAHKASVVGDTVGDPYKDTAGPAINALIKVINTIAVIIAPVLAGIFLG